MSGSDSNKDSITQVAEEESFVRERPLEIERGAVLAGRYQVEEVIGKGGSGVVLRVFDRTVQNVVALKVLKSELARDAKWDKRFSRELRLGRPIQHPNVCRIFDIGEADGHRFLTMELATGGSLRDELKRRPALERPIEDRLKDARAAVEGLAAIHATGVVHRDFKPDNLLRMEDGRLVISDFGLATDAAAAPGVTVMIGTPHYMAPEVLAGEPATTRSDVWALGVVLHEIFFGRRPERKTTSFDGSGRGPIRPATATERGILELCERCLAETPAERPLTAAVVAAELAVISGGRGRRRRGLPRAAWVVGVMSLLVAAYWARRIQTSRRTGTAVDANARPQLEVSGEPADWSKVPVVAEISGRVHCLSRADAARVTVIWGEPRQAVNIDVRSGVRVPSPLPEDAYRMGCPDISGDGGRVLYTARTSAGGREIRLSTKADGRDAVAITSGADPLWLNEDEFLYEIDTSHVALFSLATATVALLPNAGVPEAFGVQDKAVGQGNVAVLYSAGLKRILGIFRARDLRQTTLLSADGASRVRFGTASDTALLSYRSTAGRSTLIELDWKTGRGKHLARYGDYEIVEVLTFADGGVALARRSRNDGWYVDDRGPHRVPGDGRTYSVSVRNSGEALIGQRDATEQFDVWLATPDGRQRKITRTGSAVAPAFDGAGSDWAYTDYGLQAIVLCEDLAADRCRPLYHDDSLPAAPAFSPDGRLLSAMTQLRAPKVLILSKAEGQVVGSWDASPRCPPLWSSHGTVWTLATVDGHFVWTEHKPDGAPTGNRLQFSDADPGSNAQCWPAEIPGAPGLRRSWTVREEDSRLLKVPERTANHRL